MTGAMRFEKHQFGDYGRYRATIEGRDGAAEIHFSVLGPKRIRADHTEAPESLRGSGAALALVEHMVADARANGFAIVAVCPYIRAQLKRHPDWSDVMRLET